MSRLRTFLAAVGTVLLLSLSFVSCGDDNDFPKDTMGACAINSCQATATSCTIYWTLVPNSNCDGYQITLYTGTRDNLGSVVEDKTFDFRTGTYTFQNLTPSTTYVVKTQCIPSKTSGFTKADLYYKQFTTAAQ